ncbi:MAG: hypothetical protein IKE65_01730 [Clostridia bacterium]|nr:hypothetical protein [Clostridia bacterium]
MKKNKKKTKTIVICIAIAIAVLLANGITIAILYNNGLLGFYHPQQQAKSGQVKIACVGDSITYGYGISSWSENNYPAQLQRAIGEGFCVNNFGYSGRTAQSMGDRAYVKEKLYEQSLAFEPDIVIFMLGSNDSKPYNWDRDNFVKDYKALVESYMNLPNKPQVYLMAPPPVFEVNGKVKYDIQKDIIAEEIVPIIKQIAKEEGLACIDLYKIFEGKEALFSDGCHPTETGAKIIAATVQSRLSEDLAKE